MTDDLADDVATPARDPAHELGLELGRALAARGVEGRVEEHGRLALLVGAHSHPAMHDVAARRELVVLAAAHGFSHLALELEPGDDAARGDDAPLRGH